MKSVNEGRDNNDNGKYLIFTVQLVRNLSSCPHLLGPSSSESVIWKKTKDVHVASVRLRSS